MPRDMRLQERIQKLREFWRQERRVPVYAEMLDLFGYKSKNAVFGLLKRLEEAGYVTRDSKGRMAFLPKLTGTVRLLGSIAAGFPTPEEEQAADATTLDDYLVRNPDRTFMLTVPLMPGWMSTFILASRARAKSSSCTLTLWTTTL